MERQKVGIWGFGTMGSGIACVALEHGYDVVAYDSNEDALRKGRGRVNKYLEKHSFLADTHHLAKIAYLKNESQKNEADVVRVQNAIDAVKERLTTVSTPDFADCFIVIECVFENVKAKQAVFFGLTDSARINAILATNTSSIPIRNMANVCGRPSRVIGLHFSNPPTHVKGVEIIPSEYTSPETLAETIAFAKSIGQEPFVVMKDSAGFVGNRILAAQFMEACHILKEGVANEDTIQGIALKHLNFPYGPLWVADHIGLDVFLGILETLAADLPEGNRFAPPPILRRLVAEGKLGRKTKEGFYSYPEKTGREN